MTETTTETELREPPRVSGGEHENGHLEELRTDPIALMQRTRDECGDVGEFVLAGRPVVLLTDAGANEWFFRGLPKFPEARAGIDENEAIRHLSAILKSFQPSHEHKEAAVAWLASRWLVAEQERNSDAG